MYGPIARLRICMEGDRRIYLAAPYRERYGLRVTASSFSESSLRQKSEDDIPLGSLFLSHSDPGSEAHVRSDDRSATPVRRGYGRLSGIQSGISKRGKGARG